MLSTRQYVLLLACAFAFLAQDRLDTVQRKEPARQTETAKAREWLLNLANGAVDAIDGLRLSGLRTVHP